MAFWERYKWAELDAADLPLGVPAERSVMPFRPHLSSRASVVEKNAALALGFDARHTFYTVLTHEWGGHPAGSRVLIEITEIAIERDENSVSSRGRLF